MSIIDHSRNYDVKLDYMPEDANGKFFWFSGFDLDLPKHTDHIYDKPKRKETVDENFNEVFEEDICYATPNKIVSNPETKVLQNSDSLYEIPVDKDKEIPVSEFHHYDIPGAKKANKSNGHQSDTPNQRHYENVDKYRTDLNTPGYSVIEDKRPSPRNLPDNGGHYMLNGHMLDVDSEKDIELKEEPVYLEPKYANHVNLEYNDFRNNAEYASGVWFGFSGKNIRRQQIETPLPNNIPTPAPNNIPVFYDAITTKDVSTMEEVPSIDIDYPLTTEHEIKPVESSTLEFAPKDNFPDESEIVNSTGRTNLDDQFAEIDKLVMEFNDLSDFIDEFEPNNLRIFGENSVQKSVSSYSNIFDKVNQISPSKGLVPERPESPDSPPARPPPPKSRAINHNKHPEVTSAKTETESEILEVNKTYSIEIKPDKNEKLDNDDESTYHITFVKKDGTTTAPSKKQSLVIDIEDKPKKEFETNSLPRPKPPSQQALKKSYSMRGYRSGTDNTTSAKQTIDQNPRVGDETDSLPRPQRPTQQALQKSYSLRNLKKKSEEEKQITQGNGNEVASVGSKDESPNRRRGRPLQKSYSVGREDRNRNETRRSSSRFVEEQPVFSSLKNFFEDPTSPIQTRKIERQPIKSSKSLDSGSTDKKERKAKSKIVAEEETISFETIRKQFESPNMESLDDQQAKSSKPRNKSSSNKNTSNSSKPANEKHSVQSEVLPRRMSLKSQKKPSVTALKGAPSVTAKTEPSPRNLRRSKDDSEQPRISIRSHPNPKVSHKRSKSVGARPAKVVEDVLTKNSKEMKVFYQFQDKQSKNSDGDDDSRYNCFYSAYRDTEVTLHKEEGKPWQALQNGKHLHHVRSVSSLSNASFISSDGDEENTSLSRGTSFRRSIVIDDEVDSNKQKKGEVCISVFFQPVNGETDSSLSPSCQKFKNVLNYIDNLAIEEESFGIHFDAVRQLHQIFWDLKDNQDKPDTSSRENLTTVLDYLVAQEWPKVILGCLKKLTKAYPRVFIESNSPENIIYYSGHLPSVLRMNRTSAEFAMSAIFDGLLKAAINFTDVHAPSRIACIEENLIEYLVQDLIPLLRNIRWGKKTARESFLKSTCDLLYNCSQSSVNAPYLIKYGTIELLCAILDETYEEANARKITMTMLLALSYLLDDSNQERIVPSEGLVIRMLQFLDKSLEHSEHTYLDFFAAELSDCISRLCSHDSNREYVTQNSGQEILHKLLKHAYDDEERIAACNALWNLSFNHEAKNTIREMGKLLNMLRELKNSKNKMLSFVASGVLWECEEKYDLKGTRETHSTVPDQVMISYEEESRLIAIGIHNELKLKGFQVTMHYDKQDVKLQEIMTRGVERTSIMVVALTRKYKQTPHSYAEIDYAYKLRKCIVPVIIEKDFYSDGWLGEYMKSSKTFDFSKRSMVSGSLDALVQYVTSLSSKKNSPNMDLLSSNNATINRDKDVLLWSNNDVISWLKENNLIRSLNFRSRLQKLTGIHFLMLYDLKKESPDYYYTVLDSHLGFKDVLDTLEFTNALDKLLGSERLI